MNLGTPRVGVVLGSGLGAVRTGLAIGLLPPSFVGTTDEIAFVPIRDHPPQFQTAIAVPANRRLSAATRAMLETIEHHAGA